MHTGIVIRENFVHMYINLHVHIHTGTMINANTCKKTLVQMNLGTTI